MYILYIILYILYYYIFCLKNLFRSRLVQSSLIEEDLEDLEYGLEQIAIETASIDDDGVYAQYVMAWCL
jgi:hypothetical protein